MSDEAKRAASAMLTLARVERDGFELYLPPAFLRLDPGDVVQVRKASAQLTASLQLRLTAIDLSIHSTRVPRPRASLRRRADCCLVTHRHPVPR
jgi:hypothetical protein